MPALDRDARTPPPAVWAPADVLGRLLEAYEIEGRLPAPRRQSAPRGSSWPAITHEFADLAGWGDEAREAVWADWARARGAHPYEVTRMEEAMSWLRVLDDAIGERRAVEGWARAMATGASLRKVLARLGCSRATFYRRRDEGAKRLAAWLNDRGAALR
ncbi:MAG TPA: DUF6362 family protein [Stellaceae bacterium]|jgi:hypothetical protein|nr:DUF6362 family protein [Stellaceae bacterium]